jgi:translation initiation factor IF-3
LEVNIRPQDYSRFAKKDTKKARINHHIRSNEVRLIDEDGGQLGVVAINIALNKAQDAGLDLVEVSPNAAPPVCRIMDYGKYVYELSKRQKNKTKQIQVKELKLRPVTDIGDYTVKLRKAIEFLKDGDKVKFTVRFRGREMTFQTQGRDILRRIENDLKGFGAVETLPKLEGKQLVMIVAPAKK